MQTDGGFRNMVKMDMWCVVGSTSGLTNSAGTIQSIK